MLHSGYGIMGFDKPGKTFFQKISCYSPGLSGASGYLGSAPRIDSETGRCRGGYIQNLVDQ